MGVSGSGKTTIGSLLSKELGLKLIEGDDHHPTCNIDKMARGIPLTDEDRMPWLEGLHKKAIEHLQSGCIITCSALKFSYRKILARSIEDHVTWVYLKGDYNAIYDRILLRKEHFMKSDMLKSQFDTLEEPNNAVVLDIDASPEIIIQRIKNEMR